MCAQRRLRSAWASAQFDQSLRCALNGYLRIINFFKRTAKTDRTVCLCWGLTSQSTIFQSCWDGAIASWVINQYFRGVKCLAQGHNTAAVGFEPPTSRSGVRHSTTEPPRSPWSDWAYAQADLVIGLGVCPGWSESLLDAQLICLFCHAVAQIIAVFLTFASFVWRLLEQWL